MADLRLSRLYLVLLFFSFFNRTFEAIEDYRKIESVSALRAILGSKPLAVIEATLVSRTVKLVTNPQILSMLVCYVLVCSGLVYHVLVYFKCRYTM